MFQDTKSSTVFRRMALKSRTAGKGAARGRQSTVSPAGHGKPSGCPEVDAETLNPSVLSSYLRPHGPQAPLSMAFSRQESWSELPFPLPDAGIEPMSLVVSCSAGGSFTLRILYIGEAQMWGKSK